LAGFGRARVVDDDALEDQTKPSVAVERDSKIGGVGDSLRWTAPEMMDPDRFGFTKDLAAKLPSKSTDTYALGMTILEVSVNFETTLVLVISRLYPLYRSSPGAPRLVEARTEGS
jgi:hypothetical protein